MIEGRIDGRAGAILLTPAEREQGWFLPCVTTPASDCVIDAGGDDEAGSLHVGVKPSMFTAELARNERVTAQIHHLRLALRAPLQFRAGQFVQLEVPGGTEMRAYSIASAPSETTHLDLYVQRRPEGRFSRLLDGALTAGASIRALGPLGQLRVRLSHRPIVMVAHGSGLAPMLSMLGDLADRSDRRPVRLFVRGRAASDLFALQRLEQIGARLPDYRFVPVISSDGRTLGEALTEHLEGRSDVDAYIGGSQRSIETTLPLLLERGLRRRNVHFDVFTAARDVPEAWR